MTPPRDHRTTESFTPPPTVEVQAIAEKAAKAVCAENVNWCQNEGPVAKLWEAHGEMEKRMRAVENEQSETRGSVKAAARQTTIIMAILALLTLGSQVVGLVLSHWHRATPAAQVAPK